MISRLSILCSLLALVAIGVVRIDPSDAQAIDAYHEQIVEVVERIPWKFEGWTSREVPLPQSATSLLNPNAIIAREYVNAERGVVATLLIVQCRDSRDMGGHYPPVCYPSNGWLKDSDTPNGGRVDGQDLRVYEFSRVVGKADRSMTIYSLFALPTGMLTGAMKDVRQLSANYDYRKYGAAQLQVLINGTIPLEEHQWILEDMYRLAKPTLDAVIDAQVGQTDEGGL